MKFLNKFSKILKNIVIWIFAIIGFGVDILLIVGGSILRNFDINGALPPSGDTAPPPPDGGGQQQLDSDKINSFISNIGNIMFIVGIVILCVFVCSLITYWTTKIIIKGKSKKEKD